MMFIPASHAQSECGIVDAIDYPIDIADTLRQGYDDFSLFRARFGGLHTGIDIGFNRRGEPIRAAARGRVTYSDVNGWDTEKGVVIIEHTMPDMSIVYTVYGHMEQTDNIFFPIVGACVERGEIVGTIGWPSRGLPHLHYEIRNFLPNDGGPGYVTENPLLLGWYHPMDFTLRWQARLNPAVTGYAELYDFPTLPPVLLDTGVIVIASGSSLIAYSPPSTRLWQIDMDSVVTTLAGLPGGRMIAHSRSGQVIQMFDGRIVTSWTVEAESQPFTVIGESLIFAMQSGGLNAFSADGSLLWSSEDDAREGRVVGFKSGSTGIAIAHRHEGSTHWQAYDTSGLPLYEAVFNQSLLFSAVVGGWIVIDGMDVLRFDVAGSQALASTGIAQGRSAALTTDPYGNSYYYAGDREQTLLAIAPDGNILWRVRYPQASRQSPLLDTGGGCLLYALDDDGMLNVFSTTDGALLAQTQLYSGGAQNSHPRARLLRVDEQERVLMGSGFLSLLALDGRMLVGAERAACYLG
jgi:murein DD-endopeptidase MepM/ murein hydrolase activator NlpD